jgi:uncharacterized protein YcbX
MMIVSEVNIYPIKSCAGTRLDVGVIEARGFANDRRWLLVDEDWRFLTQREIARMALIKPDVDDRCLRLSAPGMSAFELPVDQDGKRAAVTIWKDSGVGAIDQGDDVAQWFSDYVGRKVRLVRFADDYMRQVSQQYAPRETDQVGFADGYPFLIISEDSLADLNARLETKGEQALPMNRFRPNIVVRDAGEPYAEDTWRTIKVGDVLFDLVKPCARCAITTTNQVTAERGKEPLKTLATYRKDRGGPLFGQNAIQRSTGVVKTGTPVEVVEYRYE